MVRIIKFSLIVLLVLAIFLSGCTKYVCYDGTVQSSEKDCPIVPVPTVELRRAEMAVDTFSQAYARALGASHHRVNTYRAEGNWNSELLFTNTQTGTVNHVKLMVDGKTSSVSCIEGCSFLERKDIVEDITNNTNTSDSGSDNNSNSGFSIY